MTEIHPLLLKAKSETSKGEWSYLASSHDGPLAYEYSKAAEREIATLEEMNVWDVTKHEDEMNVINGFCAVNCKWFPKDTVKNCKACCCACGNQHIEGIGFFEIYSPVVQWNTVCMMLILTNLLGLKSKQADVLRWGCSFTWCFQRLCHVSITATVSLCVKGLCCKLCHRGLMGG